ncbi:peroxiredoxin [Phreatobacter sp.]|uniref:peroxiredoxin n=1 Tax=Phreatobacter sp. TaxID=1966341 RepID=UPI003F72A192
MALGVGDKAPDFELPGDGGRQVRLADYLGRKLVLYFYPKADTGTCTVQAQEFTRLKPEFDAAGLAIVGVSHDPVRALDRFRAKRGLEVTLATDEGTDVLEAYGVWAEKSMYGRKYMGIERTTFLIGADGRILRIWPRVTVKGHAEEVLEAGRGA